MENIHRNEHMHNITSGDYMYCQKIKQLKEQETSAGALLERNVRKVSCKDHLKQIYVKGGNQPCE